ncbi:hypothetical protein BFL34_02868 [Clavibacter michiganensis]|uniref:Lipoprotein n=1 Tax=Clavibacter michiganensis TaxID=28447 RepID=A0A251Y1J0_9MICO|nr:hypothetical protein [Clavibacter michiganensis]OUE18115.1 hypothetical protein BFL34_02868 [Clavibacter michiganensis]
MRARLMLVPALVVALAGCSTPPPRSSGDDARLIAREAQAMPDAVDPVALADLDGRAPLEAASLVAWHPSDIASPEAWVDVSWTSGDPACGGQVESARVVETDARVVIDLSHGESHLAEGGAACGDVGYRGSARIPLAAPVGDRELLQHAPAAG